VAIAPQFSSAAYVRATLGTGKVAIKGKKAKVPVDSAPGSNPCQVKVKLLGSGKGRASATKKKKKGGSLGKGGATIAGGQSATVKVKLTKHGRKAVSKGRSVRVQVTTIDPAGNTQETTKVKLGKKHKKKHKK
jgi:hypothetical protein